MNQFLRESVIHGSHEYPFAIYNINNPRNIFNTPLHWHDEIEIILVNSGVLYITIGQNKYEGKPGDLYIINSREIHGMYFDNINTSYSAILFPMSSLIFMNMDNVSKNFLMTVNDGKITFPNVINEKAALDRLRLSVGNIIKLNEDKSQAYMLGTKVKLLEIIYTLFSYNLIIRHSSDVSDRELHRNILSYIGEKYSEDISLPSVAGHFHMSPKYFSRFFKKTFNITFIDYLTNLRIEKASNLLSTSDLSVTEVALASGFTSCSYFNKRFKKIIGVTPNEYRK